MPSLGRKTEQKDAGASFEFVISFWLRNTSWKPKYMSSAIELTLATASDHLTGTIPHKIIPDNFFRIDPSGFKPS
ncbi:hypothetical protein KL930_000353 [Ogataea haglerorum]|uniref:Uncharacterized protein n=1 Tax=Ogataea haglerorum TaxID=1937702 RepID=A0AAN6I034_9ASCO|nr:uncharacterized protein KL911_000778 [Ogataea haglerorum]KAG7697592.1 hypothetical protein KL951_002166 [Ogataea haglerorum]KAG7701193.1 hypothetical protein KL915_000224 [Ogataea haglerorum]KAG7705900.1 hypothetical protein KL950_003476 [Ogataea haglerorum]KAG7709151.1 hypothetical protein KL914_001541 [Ogataea haglerorum]KAG7715279.1 hypothetical protein KL913_004111 [Ogataea haglerorum]